MLPRAPSCSHDLVVVRERLQSLRLQLPQPPVASVEWPDVRTWLALDGRRRPRRVQLEQERPVPASPAKQRLRMPALLRPQQVVLAGRDRGQQVTVPAVYLLVRLGQLVACLQIADGVEAGDVGS